MATTTIAAHKALGIPELLEAILIELSPFDLIRKQRTTKTFKAIIECSTKIRQKLFYKVKVEDEDGEVNINPFLPLILRCHGFDGKIEIFDINDDGHVLSSTIGNVEKILFRQDFRARASETIALCLHCFEPELFKPTAEYSAYKDMLISNPSKEITVRFWRPGKPGTPVCTLGQLAEACCFNYRRHSDWRNRLSRRKAQTTAHAN